MANVNFTRGSKLNQKRTVSIFSGELNEAAVAVPNSSLIGIATGNELIAVLPPNSIITNAYLFTKTASNAATSAAFVLGTTEGGTEIMSAGNAKTLGKTGTFTGMSDTGTGKNVYLGRTITGAATAVGKYVVVIEYLEYQKTTGEYTQLANT